MLLRFVLSLFVLMLIDYYAFQAFRTVFQDSGSKLYVYFTYWAFSVIVALFVGTAMFFGTKFLPPGVVQVFAALVFITVLAKLMIILFLLGEDITRGVRFVWAKFSSSTPATGANGISRSEFLNRLAIISAAIPLGTLIYGMVANAYNYQYRKVSIKFPNLPDAFHGFKIIQLSDIHSGSFTRTEPLKEAVEHINSMNADVIFFTGDLVNNISDEMDNYMDIFSQLKAKHGVLSVTGNHDYGDYVQWESKQEKRANFEKFKGIHKALGWDLLMNENRILERDGQKIAIMGIENWGKGRFAKYGKMPEAHTGTDGVPFKILMSHDPSHWDEQVRPQYPDVDLMFSGHTHGAQFGIESRWLKWSPSQWVYKQWAGLYREGRQYLYVNRGFGFLGYPGRVGILPEVAEITLLKG